MSTSGKNDHALFVLILLNLLLFFPNTAFCDFGDYSLNFYGGFNWTKDTYSDVEPEYDTGNFWVHDYYEGNTHIGEDYQVGPNAVPYSPVYSPGYGVFAGLVGGTYGQITIEHLLDCGETVYLNLLHSQEIEGDVIPGSYVAFGQKIAIEGNEGTVAYHLHVEYSNQSDPDWLPSITATPRSTSGRDSTIFLDDLKAHYDTASPGPKYYAPREVTAKYKELLPYLSRSENPSFDNYDVYGIEGEPLYGAMTLERKKSAKSFYAIGILARYDLSRATDTPVAAEDGKWLAQSWEMDKSWNDRLPSETTTVQPNMPMTISGFHRYGANDYKVKAFLAEDVNTTTAGYPVTFTVLPNSASVLVDNDQRNTESYKFIYFDNSSYGTEDYDLGEENHKIVPGYYMSAILAKPKTGSFAQWFPGKSGEYEIYVHIPEGASGLVEYKIKEDGVQSVKSELVDHGANQGQWVQLKVGQKDRFKFTSAGYVGVSLAADANVAVMDDQLVGIDAMKFVSGGNPPLGPVLSLLLQDDEAPQTMTQKDALMAIYNATGGDNWAFKFGWNDSQNDDITTWYGVQCDPDGNVTHLSLWLNNLTGSIPPEIKYLTKLQELDLSNNKLTGPILQNLTALKELTSLTLQANNFSGAIPTEIQALTKLTVLNLDGYALTGSIPKEIGRLSALKNLSMSITSLTGQIPSEIGNLTNLQYLSLYSNNLDGPIPNAIGNIHGLRYLVLHNNQLSGPIPSSIGNLTNLYRLKLNNNQLTGAIPESLTNLTDLVDLLLDINELDYSSASEDLIDFLESKNIVIPED